MAKKENFMTLIGLILAIIGVFLPNIVISGTNIGFYASSSILQYLSVLIVLAIYLSMKKIVPSLKIEKQQVHTYILAAIAGIGAYGLFVGTVVTTLIPWIIKLFPVNFLGSIYEMTGVIIIPIGSLLVFIGGLICFIDINTMLFDLHFKITGNRQ